MRLLKLFIPLIILLLSPVANSESFNILNAISDSGDIKLVKEMIKNKKYTVYIEGENIQIDDFIDDYGDVRFESLPKIKVARYKKHISFQSLKNSIVIDREGKVRKLNLIEPDYSDIDLINKFADLDTLYISGLSSKEPLDLSSFESLEYLMLFDNKSTEIIFPRINKIKTINIMYTDVEILSGLEYVSQLESLDLVYTKLRSLSGFEKLRNIKRLDLHTIGESFAGKVSLFNLNDIKYLTVDGGNLSQTKDISKLENLTYLIITEVDRLDEVVLSKKLESLIVTALNSNAFPQIENCENLNFLKITDANFTSVPDLKRLTKLKEVKLENNQLKDIAGLRKLVNLEELYLKDNNISQISDLAGLKKLRLLDLEDNQIKSVSGLRDMPSLKAVNFENNPVESVDFEMVDQFKGVMFNISETPFHETSTLEQRKRMGMYY
ncbi:leucine-rich repeat domain-containing protein [Photobacterium sp. Hal280]|uniref:leucine-rich repeat domain-containing protein n=1 Tax=Photobacterium sp. Hal280 TaxID=3035163 RepID=UPI00301DDE1A